MPFPFSFTGVISGLDGASRDEVYGKLRAALVAEGAADVRGGGDAIDFRGITGSLSLSPLTNVARGKIWIDDRGAAPTLTYMITIERWGFVGPLAAILASLILLAAGVPQFRVFAAFGAALVVAVCVNSLVIRVRFPHWLRKVLAAS